MTGAENPDAPPEGIAGEPGTESVEQSSDVEYGVDERPPTGESALLGLQHYLTMVGANIAVPLALAAAMGMPDRYVPLYVGTFFVVSGVGTLLQTTVGNRYPIVQGATFSMLAPAIAIIGFVGTGNWEQAILALQGAIIVGGIVEVVLGYFGVMGWLKQYLSPVVIAPTIALIGLSLFSAPQVTMAGQAWWLVGLTVLLIVAFSQYLDTAHRVFRLYPVLLGIVAAWALATALSVLGVIPSGSPAFVDLAPVANASLVQVPMPLQWGMPTFQTSFVIGMFAGVLASMIESFGDYHAVARLAGERAPSARRIDHGIGMEGLATVFAGVMGTGNGSTSYSENIGAIGLTGVASRYVIQIGAVLMLVVGFVGYFGALITTIPDPIVGGLYIAMFGQIAAVGLSNLKHVDLDSSRNVFIIGLALFCGLAFPAYMGNVGSASAFQAGMASTPLVGWLLGLKVVSDTVYVVGGTGMAVGGIVAFVLDNTVEGTREERGLDEWDQLTESDEAFESAYERYVKGD
ncbi:purine/pyrimidine permease [Halarchaeum sp. CBA1220]|uniref:uracil-xanthine permease family protein n=1 Tax=Halarchaeum sp. CBA1220 TaxID=1853682 RepID=UPI000F3A814B|nr:solute carrier family 23 protein [Halarchaeum sp. CBA1220]QLC34539.1 purine/pyrimidine permease [Halarchaeum sp. CBA1220]